MTNRPEITAVAPPSMYHMVSLPNLNPKNERTDSVADWEAMYPPTRRATPPTNNKIPMIRELIHTFLVRATHSITNDRKGIEEVKFSMGVLMQALKGLV
jgi:hypothetical protein